MTAREAIFAKIRTSLKAGVDDDRRHDEVSARLAGHPGGVIPKRGHLPDGERIALFSQMAAKAHASVQSIAGYDAVPQAVMAYLRDKNLGPEIRMGDDARLARAPWTDQKTLTVRKGASDGNDMVGVSHALGGIAETGTVALLAGPDNPTTVNFLPEHHIVVVDARDIAPEMEALWQHLRAARGTKGMPRVVNFVTGPSRSGDIEQVLLLGAHGPRSLHILVVEAVA